MNFTGNKPFFFAMLLIFVLVVLVNYFVGDKLMPPIGYAITYLVLAVIAIWYFTSRNKKPTN